MRIAIISMLILALVLTAGCIGETPEPVKELRFEGHGSQVYTFRNDINEALKIPVNDNIGIREIFLKSEKINVVFDGSNESENAFYRVVLIDLGKIPIFLSYQGKLLKFDYFYTTDGKWYNANGETHDANNITITGPPSGNTLWLIGPNHTNKTELELVNQTIYLKGKSYSDLTLAGDKLTLVVFGVNNPQKKAL